MLDIYNSTVFNEMKQVALSKGVCSQWRRWLERSNSIEELLKVSKLSLVGVYYYYANNVLEGRFVLGEDVLSKSAKYAYEYARYALKGRFILGEEAISKRTSYAYYYANNELKGRFELGEEAISKDAEYAYWYATYVLKGRFELGEEAINNSSLKEDYQKFLLTL
jgi:hypothetical protein